MRRRSRARRCDRDCPNGSACAAGCAALADARRPLERLPRLQQPQEMKHAVENADVIRSAAINDAAPGDGRAANDIALRPGAGRSRSSCRQHRLRARGADDQRAVARHVVGSRGPPCRAARAGRDPIRPCAARNVGDESPAIDQLRQRRPITRCPRLFERAISQPQVIAVLGCSEPTRPRRRRSSSSGT